MCLPLCLSLCLRESERKHLRDRERLAFESSNKRKEKFLHFKGWWKPFKNSKKQKVINFFVKKAKEATPMLTELQINLNIKWNTFHSKLKHRIERNIFRCNINLILTLSLNKQSHFIELTIYPKMVSWICWFYEKHQWQRHLKKF